MGSPDRVFVAWEDARNLAYSGAVDVYFADVSPGSLRTNVLVDTAGPHGHQQEPALGTDHWGYPYVVWDATAGPSSTVPRLYYAGATYVNPVGLAQGRIAAATGGTIGTPAPKIKTVDDVSLVVPPAACPVDVTLGAARICNGPPNAMNRVWEGLPPARQSRWGPEPNPPVPAAESPGQVAFTPGGLTFAQPVTITIPYLARSAGALRPVWLDAATGTFRAEGLTDIRNLYVAPGLRALQFQATRLGAFYLVPEDSPVAIPRR